MSASIRLTEQVQAVIALGNVFLPNSYDIGFTLAMHTDKVYEQNIVIERLKFFTSSILSNSIFIENKNPLKEVIRKSTGNKYAVLDIEPYDSPVCNVIYLKSTAILGDHATISSMSLCSRQGQEIDYYAESDDDYSDYVRCSWLAKNQKPWWMRDDPSINDDDNEDEEKLVWTDVGLGWKEIRDDAEPTIIKFPKFSPQVLQGGLNGTQ